MNRAKQLEALRGMKFMQRKEEAMRREAVEAHAASEAAATGLNSATETAVVTAAASSSNAVASAASAAASAPVTTILMEDRFDPLSHAMGRRRFAFKAPQQQAAHNQPSAFTSFSALEGGAGGAVDEANVWESVLPSSSSAAAAGNAISMNEGNGEDDAAAEDDGAIARSARQLQQQTADGLGGRRFTLKESVRAPPMPRRLEESVKNRGDGPDTKRLRAEFGFGDRTNEERDQSEGDE